MGKRLNPLIFSFGIFITITVFFGNCAKDNVNVPVTPQSIHLEKLGNDQYNLDGKAFPIENYLLKVDDSSVFFQVIPGCSDKCPVVVLSMPYNGIPWSSDPRDTRWANNLPSGGLALDVDGPGYVTGSGEQIPYYNSSVSETVGFGGLFLPSKVTAVLVYHRFYLGRKADQYVDDFVQVVNNLNQFTYMDLSKVGFLGSSLGGFVSLHASRFTNLNPVAIAGITPLIDLKSENLEMSTVASRITTNPSLLLATEKIFKSYLRRMENVNLDYFTGKFLAAENPNSKILVIHDTWDTIVSFNQVLDLLSWRSIDSFVFQHQSSINFNTFTTDHAQSSEGYTLQKVIPVYMAYLLTRLKQNTDEKIIYYSSVDFFSAISEVKLSHSKNQNIYWFKRFIEDLCTPGLILKDFSTVSNIGTLTGAQMAGGILVNIWKAPTTIDNACGYLQANPNMFN